MIEYSVLHHVQCTKVPRAYTLACRLLVGKFGRRHLHGTQDGHRPRPGAILKQPLRIVAAPEHRLHQAVRVGVDSGANVLRVAGAQDSERDMADHALECGIGDEFVAHDGRD